jgi:hypothetical protein
LDGFDPQPVVNDTIKNHLHGNRIELNEIILKQPANPHPYDPKGANFSK